MIPSKFLETKNLNQTMTDVINCNMRAMAEMCRICLPGMEKRGKGVIVNLSSGVATIPCPLYSLYSASKVFVERFSLCLQAEYSAKGIIIQTIAPFSVSTAMIGFQKGGLSILPEGLCENLSAVSKGWRQNPRQRWPHLYGLAPTVSSLWDSPL
ncbi:unnamed protein product [Gadus morhua 'NCC']